MFCSMKVLYTFSTDHLCVGSGPTHANRKCALPQGLTRHTPSLKSLLLVCLSPFLGIFWRIYAPMYGNSHTHGYGESVFKYK